MQCLLCGKMDKSKNEKFMKNHVSKDHSNEELQNFGKAPKIKTEKVDDETILPNIKKEKIESENVSQNITENFSQNFPKKLTNSDKDALQEKKRKGDEILDKDLKKSKRRKKECDYCQGAVLHKKGVKINSCMKYGKFIMKSETEYRCKLCLKNKKPLLTYRGKIS